MTREEAVNKLNGGILGYESPIQTILSDMRLEYEENVVRVVQDVGFDVNKEELAKALSYDRGQYEKGYADAKAEYSRQHGEWIYKTFDDETGISNSYFCSCCNYPLTGIYNSYCAVCGSDMRSKAGEKNE